MNLMRGVMGSIKIGNKDYSWAELSKPEVRRAVLPQVEAMIAQFKRNPELREAQGFSVLDLQTAIRWTGGTFDGLPEETMRAYRDTAVAAYNQKATELGKETLPMPTALTTGTQPPAIDGKSAYKELTALMQDKGMRTALQKRTAGATLTAAEVKRLEHHDALQGANNGQARAEKAAKVTRPPRTSIAPPIVAPKFESAEAATARRLEHQNNLSGPYYDPSSPGYAQARAEVKAAYQLETGEAGTVKDSE